MGKRIRFVAPSTEGITGKWTHEKEVEIKGDTIIQQRENFYLEKLKFSMETGVGQEIITVEEIKD